MMDTDFGAIRERIAGVLADIREQGFSTALPFDIGAVEARMMRYAEANGIVLASDRLYMSAKQLQHCLRKSKKAKGLVVPDADLIEFPARRFDMELYYDGESFIYATETSKFIIHPNYKVKFGREQIRLVNFITATRRVDKMEFNGKRYVKI